MELQGKVAIVSGAGSGLGRFIADGFAARDARVLAVDVVAGRGVLVADVATGDGRDAVVSAADELGGVDVLVHNAGGWSRGGAQYPDAPAESWRAALELDLLTPMALTQLCLPQLRSGGGAVVNIASSAGVGSTAYGSPEYAAAKAGLIRFTTSVADWRERYGVRVNCVVPGWIGLERAEEQLAGMTPGERAHAPTLVAPSAVVDQVLRLASDASLSGRVVVIFDGDTGPVLLP